MTPDQLVIWAAGFFDGEGYIGAHVDPRDGRVALRMSVVQCGTVTDPSDTLLRFKEAVGGIGSIGQRNKGRRGKTRDWRPSWCWYANTTDDIRTVAHLLLPYLGDAKVTQVAGALSQRSEYQQLLYERKSFCQRGHELDPTGPRGPRRTCWECHGVASRAAGLRRSERYRTDPDFRARLLERNAAYRARKREREASLEL